MTKTANAASKPLLCLRWCVAVATIAVLALLAAECVDIYLVGNSAANLDANGVHLQSVYRWEDVTARLSNLSIPLLAYVALVVLAGVAHLIYAVPMATKHAMSPDNRLRLLKARVAEMPAGAAKEERYRRNVRYVAALGMILLAVPCIIFLANREHFTSWDLEMVMGDMLLHVAPWVAAAFIVAIVSMRLCERSTLRELEALKGAAMGKPETVQRKTFPIGIVRIALYAAAVLFIVLGVMNGGLRDVLVKAINICTECIGLG